MLRVDALDVARHVERIDIRDEQQLATLRLVVTHGVVAQGLVHELGAEIAAADSDGDHGGELLARHALE